MRPIWFVRAAVTAAALFTVSFISFTSAPGSGLFTANPPQVDRSFKGDRLPLIEPADSSKIGAPAPPTQQSREKAPVGCEGAFSPIASPPSANVFRRCMV
jgi:hypothetical protein